MDDPNVVVLNKRASRVEFSTPDFSLVPGENDVPKSVLDENMRNPNGVVRSWFDEDSGFLEIKKGAKRARALADDLSSVTEKRALEIVKGSENADLLRRWGRKEKRSPVKKAIIDRINALEIEEKTRAEE